MDWQTLEIVSCVVDAIYALHVIFSLAFSVMVSGLVVPTRKGRVGFNEYRQLSLRRPSLDRSARRRRRP